MKVVTRAELRARGCTWAQARANLDAGRWQALNDQVLCLHNGPLTRCEQWTAAYFSARPPAALGGLTALRYYGVRTEYDENVHVVTARGARPLAVKGVQLVVHESRRFRRSDVVVFGEVGFTEIHRAVIDACAWTPDPAAAARLLVATVQQRRAWPDRLATALSGAGRVRHAGLLRRLLADLA